jgi:hypothetical protein
MRWFGLFLVVVGGLLSFFMASKMWMQHAMISTAVPVDAMVNESRVEELYRPPLSCISFAPMLCQ